MRRYWLVGPDDVWYVSFVLPVYQYLCASRAREVLTMCPGVWNYLREAEGLLLAVPPRRGTNDGPTDHRSTNYSPTHDDCPCDDCSRHDLGERAKRERPGLDPGVAAAPDHELRDQPEQCRHVRLQACARRHEPSVDCRHTLCVEVFG